MDRSEQGTNKPDIALIVEGEYNCSRVNADSLKKYGWPEKTFAVGKGKALLGFITSHPCGEWTFQVSRACPALRHESIAMIGQSIRLADVIWRHLPKLPSTLTLVERLQIYVAGVELQP